MNPVADVISKDSVFEIAPGFVESSEEASCMKPFKDHPKGLVAYEHRCVLETYSSNVNSLQH